MVFWNYAHFDVAAFMELRPGFSFTATANLYCKVQKFLQIPQGMVWLLWVRKIQTQSRARAWRVNNPNTSVNIHRICETRFRYRATKHTLVKLGSPFFVITSRPISSIEQFMIDL